MNEIGEKFLPIGTVLMLNGGTKRVMITGFCSAAQEKPDSVWDYTGCPYPEGYITSNQTCLFNHNQIKEVFHLGLHDDAEEKEFKEALKKLINTMDKKTVESKNTNNQTTVTPNITLQPNPDSVE